MPSLVNSQANEPSSNVLVSKPVVLPKKCDPVVEIFDFIAENIDQPDLSSVVRRFGARETKAEDNPDLHQSMRNMNTRLSYLELENGDGVQNNVLLSRTDLQDNPHVIKDEKPEKNSSSHSCIFPEDGFKTQEVQDKIIKPQENKIEVEKTEKLEKISEKPVSTPPRSNSISPSSKNGSPETGDDEDSPEQDEENETEPSSRSGNSTLKNRRNSQKKKRRKSKLYF